MTAISAVAVLVTLLAILASAKRLAAAYDATTTDPALLAARFKSRERDVAPVTVAALATALAEAHAEPEATLVRAMLAPPEERAGRTNEVLLDIDDRVQRWARVPRVAASVASTTGFLLASLAMRQGLALTDDLPPELREVLLYRSLGSAFDAVAFGIFGALTCVLLHSRARIVRRDRSAAVDALVQELESRSGLPAVDRVV